MNRAPALAVILLSLAATRSDPLAGRVPGAPRSCLDDLDRSGGPTIVDDHTILYRRSGKRIWVTHPDGPCPSLRPFSTLIVEQYGSQLCAGDRFRTIEPPQTIPSGFCRFTRFTPYDKP